jgi:hypothetical protein
MSAVGNDHVWKARPLGDHWPCLVHFDFDFVVEQGEVPELPEGYSASYGFQSSKIHQWKVLVTSAKQALAAAEGSRDGGHHRS